MSRATVLFMTGLMAICFSCSKQEPNYPANREPLKANAFIQLPLGTVKPAGWLKDQLQIQANGLPGHLDEYWPDLITSAWHGGEGEAWERGPYYLDGMVPLAYLLDDQRLLGKVKTWIEPILASGQPNGWFGPAKNRDRWPLAVGLKVLKSYYEGSKDPRALEMIKKYFTYLAENKSDWPDKEWRGVRAMENAVTGYWLFRQTGDTTILKALRSIHADSFSWSKYFTAFPWDSTAAREGRIPKIWDAVGLTAHVVNNAMATKYPGIWSQQSGNDADLQASYTGLANLDAHHGQVGGRFSGDEHLSGRNPVQGTEMCAVVEYMFSLENLIEVTGDVKLADRLDILAFNSLPGTCTADYWAHQYDQQANQVLVSNAPRPWSSNRPDANVFGTEPDFGCCTANGHQGWPKYTQSLWMASADGGLAAISYAPCTVNALAGAKVPVGIEVQSNYPFEDKIVILINPEKETAFPLYLRIPEWASKPTVAINGEPMACKTGEFLVINRKWKKSDRIELVLASPIRIETRYNNAAAVAKGPLFFSLRIAKNFTPITTIKKNYQYMGSTDWMIEPASPWNFGLLIDKADLSNSFEVVNNPVGKYPFGDQGDLIYNTTTGGFDTLNQNPPIMLKAKGKIIPDWVMENNNAGLTPQSPVVLSGDTPVRDILLVPYASAKLRVSEIPLVK
ncbi:MAG: beta-L-arabinofuranosidase domain-containing protein [Bacteroidales bacterium]